MRGIINIDVIQIIVIIVLSGLAYWANDMLNKVPTLKQVVSVLIVVVAVLMLLQSLDILHSNIHVN